PPSTAHRRAPPSGSGTTAAPEPAQGRTRSDPTVTQRAPAVPVPMLDRTVRGVIPISVMVIGRRTAGADAPEPVRVQDVAQGVGQVVTRIHPGPTNDDPVAPLGLTPTECLSDQVIGVQVIDLSIVQG